MKIKINPPFRGSAVELCSSLPHRLGSLKIGKLPSSLWKWVLILAFECGLSGLGRAAGSNALDRIDFGNANSEQSHSFDTGFTSLPNAGTGAMGQTFRQPLSGAAVPGNGELAFTMTVDPVKQNYVTVRMWGSDNNGTYLYVVQSAANLDPLDMGASPPPFPNRFYYETMPIALALTQGKTSIQLVLYEPGVSGTSGRPVYSAYTHTDPHFIPDGSDPTGSKLTVTGQLPTTSALSLSQVVSLLQTNRQAIYGSGGYYDTILARQVTPGTTGAPPEVIGLDLYSPVANFGGTSQSYDNWRDTCGGGGHGPGYSTLPDEMLSVLTATYLLPPFTDANGNVVSGLDHYHDATIIPRIVECLDGTSYLQSSDGHYQAQPYPCWNGLTSTPRATGHYYAGTTARGQGWTITLEGADTDVLGRTILAMLNDSTAAPIFENYLSQSYDADLNGGSVLRANAYERMLNNQLEFLYSIFGAGTISQGLFGANSIYINSVALAKLQALYPDNVSNTNFPASTVYSGTSYTFPYPALTSTIAVNILEQMTGAVAATSTVPGLSHSGYTNYAISAAGFGEAHGTISGGYDGRYGTILPWIAANLASVAGLDPAASGTPLSLVQTQAQRAADGYLHFISPLENFSNLKESFTLAQEDYITYRDPYSPNADCGSFTVGTGYMNSDPSVGINSALELRGAYLEAVYGIIPGTGKGGNNQLLYLEALSSYENTLRSLVNVDPSTLTPLPGEPGAGNSAFVDPQTGATAIYCNGERFYMNANWRNFEVNNNTYGIPSEIAIIHDTTSLVDRACTIYLPYSSATQQSDGNISGGISQPWVLRYGSWLIAGNPTTSACSVTLPAGNGEALDLVANAKYGMGSSVTVPAGGSVALNMPVTTTAQLIANGTYTLTNVGSQFLLDCPGGAPTNGLQIDQASPPSSANTQWIFTYLGSGYYTVKNAASGLYLTGSAAQGSGSALVQQPADQQQDQSWQLVQSGDSYVLVNEASGLDANDPGNSTSAGTGMVLSSQDAGASSCWTFQTVSVPLVFANGIYTLTSLSRPFLIDNTGSSNTSGQAVQEQVANGGTDQQWIFTYAGNGYYTIQNAASGLYLTPADVSAAFYYPNLLQETASPGNSWQLWTFVPTGDGYSILNKGTGDVFNDQGSPGSNIVMHDIWGQGATYTWLIQSAGVAAPSSPTNVTVIGGDGVAALSWTASAGATGYDVLRSTTSGSGYSVVAYNLTGTSYADSSLTDGTTYYYEVTAVNSGGQSAASTQTPATPLAAPTNLAATGNNASVSLTWTTATGAQSFNVKRSVISGGPYQTVGSAVPGTSYTDNSATNGTIYYYVVSTLNGVSESANSSEVQVIPGAISTLANGGFETPSVGTYQYNPSGASWTFTPLSGNNSSGIAANGSGFTSISPNAPQGVQVAFLQGTATISQTISGLTVGTAYTVSFSAAEPAYNNAGQTWNVTLNGTTIGSYAPPASASNYLPYGAQFTATAASETLAFVGTDIHGGGNIVLLDSVAVSLLGVPVMTNIASTSATVGSAVSFQLTASNLPTSYAATGLPAGLSVNTTSGLISGTPSATGTFNATVSATNAVGTGSAALAITINPVVSMPVISSGTNATGSVGTAFSYQITATNGATSYAATGLYPPGLSVNTSTGLISGTPSAAGAFTSTISASNSAGTGSGTLSFTIYAVPPAPTAVTGTPGYNQVTISWTTISSANTYNVKQSTVSGGPYMTVGTTTKPSFVDQNATNGTTYYYVVTALNLAGESASSSEVSATPAALPAVVPANLTAVASNDNVVLNWTLSNYATSYNLKRATTSGGPYTTLASGLTAATYTDVAVPASAAGTAYYYVVSAVNPLGESANSTPSAVTVLSPPSTPSALNLSASANSQATLAWNASTSASGYTILRGITSGGPYTFLIYVTGTSYTDTSLSAGSTYYYVVEADNAQGTSGNSNEVSYINGLFGIAGFNPASDMFALGQSGVLSVDDSSGTYASSVVRASGLAVNGGQGFSIGSSSNEPANFLVAGSGSGNTNDSFGPLKLVSGAFFGKLVPNASSNLVVTFSSLARAPGTQLIFDHSSNFGLGVGSHTLASATANSANVVFTSAPTSLMIGGSGAAGTSTVKILPFAFVNGQFATYDTTSGLRPLTSAETTTTLVSGTSLTTNERVSSHKTISAATTVNAVYLTTGGSITGTGALTLTSGALVADQSDTVSVSTLAFGSAEGLLHVGNSRTLTVNSVLTGSNGLTAGLEDYSGTTASLVLGGANTFTGPTTLEGNNASLEVVLTNGLAFQKSTLDYNNYGASLQFGSGSTNVTSATLGGLKGLQALALTNSGTSAGGVALTVGGDGDTTSYNGILSGTGSLIKSGSGTLTLAGASTYSGVTTINAGTLLLTGSLGSGSAVTVNSGTTLGGSGTVGGSVTVASGGMLAPGNGSGVIGTLTVSNGLTLQSGSVLNFDLGATASSDQILMAGTYSGPSGGTVSLNFNPIAGFGVGTYNLIVGAPGINAGSFTIGNLPSGYNYSLTAVNGTLALQVATPAAPTGLTAVASDGQVVLNWNASAGASSYILSRSTVSGGPYTAIASGLGATTYTNTGLTDGTTYYYVVQGVNNGGAGPKSSEASATPLSPFQQWLVSHNLPATTSNEAMPDGDGVPILVKYATSMTPGTMSAAGPAIINSNGNFLTLAFNRLSPAPVTYIVEASSDLVNWSSIATLTSGTTAWTASATVNETGANPIAVTVTDNVAYSASTPRFLRLRVTTSSDVAVPGTVPQGDVPLSPAAASTSADSLTLDNTPEARGTVQALTAGTLTVASSGTWATTGAPYAVRLLSGSGSGATFTITAQNGDVLSLATNGIDLTQLVAVGDTYEVMPLDTLGTLFGTTSVLFQTGSSAGSADNIQMWNGTSWLVYYPNGTNWKQAGSFTSQNNTLIPPGAGWLTLRRGSSPLTIYFVGRVPEVSLRQFVPTGITFVAGASPLNTTLSATGFNAAAGWLRGTSASVADNVLVWNGSGWSTFYNNGTNWKQAGSLLNQNSYTVYGSQPFFVVRQSSVTAGQALVLQPLNYTP